MPARVGKTMGPVEWALLIVLSLLWGGSFFFAKVAVAEIRPLSLVFCRVGLAALVLLLLVRLSGRRMPSDWKTWRTFFIMGFLNNLLPFSLIFWGQIRIASGLASILNATTPLFAVILAHLLTDDEKLSGNRLSGVLLGIAGVAVMIGPAAFAGFQLQFISQLAVLAAACSYACAGIYGRRFKGLHPLVTAAGQVSATSVMILLPALIIDQPWLRPQPSLIALGAAVGLALICTALAYLIYFRLLAAAGATNLLLVTLLIPVSAILLGAVILGERLEIRQFGGMLLIGLGLLAIDGRLPAKLLTTVQGSNRR